MRTRIRAWEDGRVTTPEPPPASAPPASAPPASVPSGAGPSATGPTATGPSATGPTATGPTATGPTGTGPTGTAGSGTLGIRSSYSAGRLTEDGLAGSWQLQLRRWYDEAVADGRIGEPNAIQVATVDAAGRPDLRTVLARGFDEDGVVFFTNYGSAKGEQLAANPVAAAVFSWLPLERQVRLRGPVSKVSREETEQYFASRQRGSQLAAWASPQSSVIAGRAALDELLAEVSRRFGDGPIPAPPQWGGYRISVTEIEFWQGREFRLHDRIRFRAEPDGGWRVERLAP
jgi:pyridoxamine 5'-phosphate oxidase